MASPPSTNLVQIAVGRLAAAIRHNPDRIPDARNELVAARVERAIREAIAPDDPDYEPLRQSDRERLAALLLEH